MKRFALCLSLFLPLAACTAPPPTGQLGQAIINGTVDDGDNSVVMMFAQVPGASSGSLCTGEVISPHVVLTAAHCVSPSTVGSGNEFIVFTGTVFGSMPPADQILKVSETHFVPTFVYNPMTGGDQDDVGVLILESPTTLPPLPVNHFPLPLSAKGAAARIVGYGITMGNDGNGATAGTRHQAPQVLYAFDDVTLTLYDKMHSNCEGDSGGPTLVMLDGKERIAGITQVGYLKCPVDMASTDTRIDTYTDFIDQYVNMFDPPAVAPGGACTQDSDCGTLPCLDPGGGAICAQPCDPAAKTSTCPAGLSCTDVNGETMCAKSTPHKGCAMGGAAPDGGPGVLLSVLGVVAALLVARRRRRA